MFVEEHADGCLEDIHDELVLFGLDEDGFDLACADLEEPGQVPVLMLVLVEHRELICALLHHRRNNASNVGVDRPVSRHKHLGTELNARNLSSIVVLALELGLQIL